MSECVDAKDKLGVDVVEGLAIAALLTVAPVESDIIKRKDFVFKADSVNECGGVYLIGMRVYVRGLPCVRQFCR